MWIKSSRIRISPICRIVISAFYSYAIILFIGNNSRQSLLRFPSCFLMIHGVSFWLKELKKERQSYLETQRFQTVTNWREENKLKMLLKGRIPSYFSSPLWAMCPWLWNVWQNGQRKFDALNVAPPTCIILLQVDWLTMNIFPQTFNNSIKSTLAHYGEFLLPVLEVRVGGGSSAVGLAVAGWAEAGVDSQ